MIKYFYFFILFLFCDCLVSIAETVTWTGAINTSWEEPGNWDKTKIPLESDDVVITNKQTAPVLNQNRTILGLKLYNSKLDLGIHTLTIAKTSDINASTVFGGNLEFLGENCVFTNSTIWSKCVSTVGSISITSVIFENDVDFTAGSWSFRLNIFKGLVTLTKNGISGDGSNGQNIYKKQTIITNEGAGNITLNTASQGDQFESDVEINVEGSGNINVSHNSWNNFFHGTTTLNIKGSGKMGLSNGHGSTTFNGDLIINSIGSGVEVGTYHRGLTTFNGNVYLNSNGQRNIFGGFGGNGMFVMAEGKSIILGKDFSGPLGLFDFTQKGGDNDNFQLHCENSAIQIRRCDFSSPLDIKCSSWNATICTFRNNFKINTRRGYSDNCNYQKDCSMTVTENYGKSTEVHLGDLTINNPQFVSAGNLTLSGNLIGNGRLGVGGYANFVGVDQYIYNTGETFIQELQLNSSGGLTLRTPIRVIGSLSLNRGNINTTTSEILLFDRQCMVKGGSFESFVNGPVKKLGNSSPFLFPIGKDKTYKPITVSYSSNTNHLTMVSVEYFNTDPTLVVPTEDKSLVSDCEYWRVQRTEGLGSVSFSFPTENCSAVPEKDLNVLYYDAITSLWKTKSSSVSNGWVSLSDFTSDYGIYALGKGAIVSPTLNYFMLGRNLNSSPVIIKGKQLRFVYNEEYLPGKLNFNIYDSKRKIILKSTTTTSFVVPTKVYGMNEISVPLASLIVDDEPYLLEVINAKGEKQYLLFKNSSI